MNSFALQADAAVAELRTLQDMLRWSVSRMHEADLFFGQGLADAVEEALLLVTHALHLPWNIDESWQQAALTKHEREQVVALIQRRIEDKIPAAYLTGVAWLAGEPFMVDERVLIPRSPIAQMIAEQFKPWWQGSVDAANGEPQPQRILDLCTGSGCLGILAAKQFPQAQVELLDLSYDALAVAEQNIAAHQLFDQVQAIQSDLFAAASGRYDLIISNPPYVDAEDMASLPEEYRHEPELALAAGEDGLDLVHLILRQARQHLTATGLLVVEVGNSFPALVAAYPQLPFVWPEFSRGGHGVFVLQAHDLDNLELE